MFANINRAVRLKIGTPQFNTVVNIKSSRAIITGQILMPILIKLGMGHNKMKIKKSNVNDELFA